MDKPPQTYGIRRYINEESIGGIILILSTLSALIWANSGWYDSYHFLWHDLQAGFGIGDFKMVSSLGHWINDGLMALFFFTVGLEIKREIMGGELSSLKKASLPIFAALGGMLLPAGFTPLPFLRTRSFYMDGEFPWPPTLHLHWVFWPYWENGSTST